MPNFINLPPFTEDGDVHVVVETPRGSRAKFAYDPKLETFILSKSLLTGLTYLHDWGFVPSTNRCRKFPARIDNSSRLSTLYPYGVASVIDEQFVATPRTADRPVWCL